MASNLHEVLSLVLPVEQAWKLLAPVRWLADRDYFIPYGTLSYNIAVKINKTSSAAVNRS